MFTNALCALLLTTTCLRGVRAEDGPFKEAKQIAKLVADDAAAADYFGRYVSVSGSTIVVGAYADDDGGSNSGSASVWNLTCNSGYTVSGTSSCSAGTLTAATCSKILCSTNQRVKDNACISCPAGTTNADGGDDPSGTDTTCDDIICGENEYVSGNACTACPPGTTNADGGDTACVVTYCAVGQHVKDNACVTCPAGTSNADGGDDASGEDTACSATKCGVDEYVSANTCAACPGGSKNVDGGDDASGDDTTCACAANERVVSNVCAACAEGETNAAGNPVPGPDTACAAGETSPSPPSSNVETDAPPPPPPPTSVDGLVADAAAKTSAAEASRDALLEGIGDEKTKAKAKLLADAAIAGVKVKKLAMALTAESEEDACEQAFSRMKLDVSLGACDAATARRRRRLVATASYDVTVMVSPVTVDETTLAAVLSNLAAEGIAATETDTDPAEALRAIPGVDSTLVESFAADAADAAAASSAAEAAASASPPPSPPEPPPSPPPPPPPLLVAEDESPATRLGGSGRGIAGATTLAAVAAALRVL